jgi:hypothetical protein
MGTNVRQNIVTNGLVMYLDAGSRMSYTSGSTTWSDLSGNGRTMTLTRSGSAGSFPTFNPTNQGVLVFDGTGSYGSGSAITGLGSSDRTINIWVKHDTLKSGSANARVFNLAADEGTTDDPAFVFTFSGYNPTGNIGFGGTPYNGYITLNITTGSWWNVCATITSTKTIIAYQNGVRYSSVTGTGNVGANPIPEIARYNNNYGQYGNPNIGIIQIYNRVLSDQEIAQNYNATKTRFGLT